MKVSELAREQDVVLVDALRVLHRYEAIRILPRLAPGRRRPPMRLMQAVQQIDQTGLVDGYAFDQSEGVVEPGVDVV